MEAKIDGGAKQEEVLTVLDDGGAVSLELVPLREGVARAFMRQSPRMPKLSEASVKQLVNGLENRAYTKIIVQDSRKGLIRRIMKGGGWQTSRAIPTELGEKCSLVTTYDLPLREGLMDSNGLKPDLRDRKSVV